MEWVLNGLLRSRDMKAVLVWTVLTQKLGQPGHFDPNLFFFNSRHWRSYNFRVGSGIGDFTIFGSGQYSNIFFNFFQDENR